MHIIQTSSAVYNAPAGARLRLPVVRSTDHHTRLVRSIHAPGFHSTNLHAQPFNEQSHDGIVHLVGLDVGQSALEAAVGDTVAE